MAGEFVETQVVVVGAGPVGLLLAGELRLGGADVVVLERLAEPTTESRASTLHARTMELLDQRGLLGPLGTPPNDAMSHFGGIPLDLGGLDTAYPGQWKVPQARTEELLREWAVGLGAEVRRGHEVRGVTEADGYVEAEAAGPAGPVRVRASYLVGCDGEDSTVRRLAGIGFPGTDATRELLRADVLGVDVRDRRFERLPGGLAIAATRNGVTRVMVHEFGQAAVRRSAAPEFAEVAAVWRRVTGEDISGGTPTWVNAFGDTCRQASTYRAGRILLAGDAAHAQMPVGGQALNLGLQDAANLGWKLAAELRGHAPKGLLDTYDAERRAVGARVLTNIRAQALLLLGGPEVEALRTVLGEQLAYAEVRRHLGGMISGLDVRYDVGGAGADGDARLAATPLGARLPHLRLITEDGPVTSAELLRSGRGLLLDLSPGDAEVAASAAGRVDVVGARTEPGFPAPEFTAALIRPDGYVVWTDPGPEGLTAALDRWFGPPERG
ncbi:FAD-dependent monooxygenase [Streptomyces sp. URMC 126]|uniref:FAD-dependent monooxygenase n=1 Tax=Streptomyces sp. URMC 126 TaxID=3423401 RepID=UPI003F1A662D